MSPARVAHGVNPLRDPEDKRLPRIAGPCSMVLFGVTGDLARKKLMPAIYDLANRGLLPPGFSLVGFARRDWATQDFGNVVHEAVRQHARTPFSDAVWRNLAEGFRFVPGTFDDPAAFDLLAQTVHELDARARHRRQPRLLPVDPACASLRQSASSSSAPASRTPSGDGRGDGSSSRSRSATTCAAPRSSTESSRRSSRRTASSGSTTTSARRRSRTCSPCGSPTSSSSRSGTPTTSTTCRSRWPRTSASAAGPATTTASARRATSSRTTCSSCSPSPRWRSRCPSTPTTCGPRRRRSCLPSASPGPRRPRRPRAVRRGMAGCHRGGRLSRGGGRRPRLDNRDVCGRDA